MDYILHYDYAAFVLSVIIIIHFYHKKGIRTNQTYVFMVCLWTGVITALMDVLTVWVDRERLAVPLVYVLNVVYLTAFNMMPFMYHLYLRMATKEVAKWTTFDKVTLFGPVLFSLGLIWSTPLTKHVFYYSVESGYAHGPGFILLYVAAAVYMLGTVTIMIWHRKELSSWQCVSVLFYVSTTLIGILIQIFTPHILMLQFVASLSLLLLYMSLENAENDEDKYLGVYNRRGFEKKIPEFIHRENRFHVLVVNITNYQSLREVVGMNFCQVMLRQYATFLKTTMKGTDLFYVSEGKFALLIESKSEILQKVLADIRAKVTNVVQLDGMNIQPETVILQLDYPTEVKSVEDIMDSIDYSLDVPFENPGKVLHLSGEILNSRRREGHVQQVMQQALANNTFQVYYQPIYSTVEKRYTSAEALIRLYDESMGFISPDEFIPMAEKNGMILKIGEFVFRSVCEMMAREKIWEKGIEYVEVNLSVVQCMQEDICEMLYGIMDEYGVPYNCVNLEVTETTLARDILWATMERMSVGGVTFSLDDYGTGYSNLTNVLKHPFHIIKLDKSMIWYAMENEAAMRALKHTVVMMRDLGMHIVAEGVETEEQMNILTQIGCEYLQGYYFSRPVPEKEFLEKLV